MTETPAPEEEVILEPGDPGYVDPNAPEAPAEPAPPPPAEPAPPGRDLQHERGPRETEAEFLSRTRGVAVESTSPTDTVPNTPQIRMGLSGQEIPPEEPAEEEAPAEETPAEEPSA